MRSSLKSSWLPSAGSAPPLAAVQTERIQYRLSNGALLVCAVTRPPPSVRRPEERRTVRSEQRRPVWHQETRSLYPKPHRAGDHRGTQWQRQDFCVPTSQSGDRLWRLPGYHQVYAADSGEHQAKRRQVRTTGAERRELGSTLAQADMAASSCGASLLESYVMEQQ